MTVLLDAGALVAIERGDRAMAARVKRELSAGRPPVTHGGVIGQVWRGGAGRQARLASGLVGLDIRAIDDDLGRRAGVLLGQARSSDVIDGALVLLAEDGDTIYTADPADLNALAAAADKVIELIEI